MDFVFELLAEIILEGCIGIAEEKRVPIVLRILCAAVLVIVYGGLIGIFIYVSIVNQSIAMFLITCLVAFIILSAFIHKFMKVRRNRGENSCNKWTES